MKHLLPALALLVALPATAAQPAKAPAVKGSSSEIVCTRESSTGSHLRKLNCMTRSQQAERRAQDRDAAQRLKEQPRAMDSGNR